tara:strand:- start:674 stop:796 length:123 start_codon:yes stop_codon:yes gene_type:complete
MAKKAKMTRAEFEDFAIRRQINCLAILRMFMEEIIDADKF